MSDIKACILQRNCFTCRFGFSFRVEIELHGLPIHVVSADYIVAIILIWTWVSSSLFNPYSLDPTVFIRMYSVWMAVNRQSCVNPSGQNSFVSLLIPFWNLNLSLLTGSIKKSSFKEPSNYLTVPLLEAYTEKLLNRICFHWLVWSQQYHTIAKPQPEWLTSIFFCRKSWNKHK